MLGRFCTRSEARPVAEGIIDRTFHNSKQEWMNMKINRIVGTMALTGLALVLTGCVVTSVCPFYFEKDLTFETALIGDWKKANQPDEHWKFERAAGDGYRIITESGGKTTVFQGHAFKLYGRTFLDLTTTQWKEDIQPEPVPSHVLARIVQVTPTVKLSAMNYDWLKELLAKDPKALRHIVIQTGEKADDRRIVLTADTAELQQFLLKHLKSEGPLVYRPGEGWQHRNTEGMWEPSVELQPDPASSPSP
jgi:hypothetical protein